MKCKPYVLAIAFVFFATQLPTFGAITRWTFSGVTFSDGGTAQGFFDLNAPDGSLGVIENWQITVSGGNTELFPEFVYTPENSSAGRYNTARDPEPRISFDQTDSARQLRVTPVAPLTDAGGVVELNLETAGGGSGGVECFNCSPTRLINGGSLIAGSAEGTLIFPQFGNGAGLISELVLTNTTSLEASCRVEFREGQGNPLTVGIASNPSSQAGGLSSIDFPLPPYATITIPTDGLGSQPQVGTAVVFSDRRVGGVVRFNISGIGIAGVGSSQPMSQFVVPVRRKLGVINSGLAIRNAEATPIQVQLTLHRSDGTVAPNGTVSISDFPASGHLSQFIDELFPEAQTEDFEGSVRVDVTGGKLSATALELGAGPGQFTTLPVIDLLGQ